MRAVKSKDSNPELMVRRLVHRLGFRFRLHGRELPGTPDLVFRPKKKVIFVHGCFWHGHIGCPRSRMPSSNIEFWAEKLENNRLRDLEQLQLLASAGWSALVIWACETKNSELLRTRVSNFLTAADRENDRMSRM